MAGVALTAGYMPFSQILLQAGRPGAYTLMTAGLVAANAVGNLLLIPLLGAQGAAIATAFSYVLMIPLLRWTAHRLIDVRL
jgi:O-antigen/teichoic acid export membrane protein